MVKKFSLVGNIQPEDLPPDVQAILAVVARKVGPGRLTPDKVLGIAGDIEAAIRHHHVTLEHRPKTPTGVKPHQRGAYRLTIAGPRIDGVWTFRSGELETLLIHFRASDSGT